MNGPSLLPDDPKLTAYALGELTGDERAAVEAALRENPALRAVVDDIRTTVQHLEAALADEPIMGTAETPVAIHRAPKVGRHAARHSGASAAAPSAGSVGPPRGEVANPERGRYRRSTRRGKLVRFPQFYYVIGGLAAACFAVLLAFNRDSFDAKQEARRVAEQAAKAQPRTTIVAVPLSAPTATPPPAPGSATEVVGINAPPPNVGVPAVAVPPSAPNASLRPDLLGGSLALGVAPTSSATLAQTPASTATPGTAALAANASSIPATTTPVVALENETPASEMIASLTLGGSGATPAGGRSDATFSVATNNLPVAIPPARSGTTRPSAARAPSTFPLDPDDEIVLLDAFTVRADILHGFTTLAGIDRAESATRGLAERKVLPRAPAGAQFTRNPEAPAFAADNDFLRVMQHPLSTFVADVDTASYVNVRRMIEQGLPPPRGAVRIEELLNYFSYRYPAPTPVRGETPAFAASLEVAAAPWAPTHRLVRIGLKSREVSTAERGPANLVFLLDVSASMADANKLPLVKESMRLLLSKLRPDDLVAIVVYAGASGLALPSTPVAKSRQILDALEALEPGGSTNGAMGIHLAYDIAKAHFIPDGINRVILCTDGDFNVGTTNDGELMGLIEEKARSGVFLTVLGFGMTNLKDATLEKLASKGNGNYGYIDTRREAEKLLVEQVTGTLVTVAKDVKIQVEFNPAKVSSYRLIGYENRQLRKEDFNNDKVDAGEIGAGHTVTALYEVVPVGMEDRFFETPAVDDLKYQAKGLVSSRLEMPAGPPPVPSNELLTVNVRYKNPDARFGLSKKMEFAVVDAGAQFAAASADFRFAAAVAQFGMILRDSPHKGTGTLGDVVAWAATAVAATGSAGDPGGYRNEFIDLVRKTQRMLR